ncbi:MAG: hypothetical protein K2P44_09330, partial [Lachnospiraceae bacterium]|nr:hypothetical protein [Lachnospiraceae bacterium]
IEKDGYAIAIRDDLEEIIRNDAFKRHMKDILEYRTMDYYRRRYEEKAQLCFWSRTDKYDSTSSF